MNDQKPTPQESMAIITRMIEASKQRRSMPDLRISVMWAVLTIVTALIVLLVRLIHYTPWINFVWFAIPVIGLPANYFLVARSKADKGAKTAIDVFSDGIWRIVGFIAIMLTAVCLVFNLMGYPQAWLAMFFYAFIVVGFGAAMQGVVLKENSYIFGGMFSIMSGFVLIAMGICNFNLHIAFVFPLYILCFLLMFIVPAIIIRKKFNARKQ